VVVADDEAAAQRRRSQLGGTQSLVDDQPVAQHARHVTRLGAARAAVAMTTPAGAPPACEQTARNE